MALRERTGLDFVGLWLKVLAEVARNGLIARAVHAADRSIRLAVAEQIRCIREARGVRNETAVDAIVEVARALCDGMSIRAVANDLFDAQAIEAVLLTATRAMLEA